MQDTLRHQLGMLMHAKTLLCMLGWSCILGQLDMLQ